MGTAIAVVLWVVLGAPAAAAVTLLGGRLLGARRSIVALTLAGLAGWTLGVVTAGVLTAWDWTHIDMVLVAFIFGTLFTMILALGLDLLAPVGTLARGEQAGLISLKHPLAGLRQLTGPVRRYRQLIGLARSNGVMTRNASADGLPSGVRQTLEDAGGMFVKVGQVASTRADVLPPAWCEELALLRSQAKAADESVMRPVVEEELGAPVEELFATFDWTPLAAASIGQVYAAELHDGTRVVVKVQRPGLDTVVEQDGGAIMQLATLIERRTHLGLAVRPRALAAEFVAGVREELDFGTEASNARTMAEVVRLGDRVRVPAVHRSTARVMVQERIDGASVADVERMRRLGIDPAEVCDRLVDTFLTQIFQAGVFHGDPHPGNLLLEDDGTITLIDLGAVGRLGSSQRASVMQLMMGVATGDAAAVRQALMQFTVLDPRADLRELDLELDELLGRHVRAGAGIDVGAFQDLTILVGRYGIRLPRWFGALSRTLLTLEGTLRTIDPTFSLVDAARHRAGAVGKGILPTSIREVIEREALTQLPRLQRFPQRVDELLGQAVEGRLTARLSLFSHERDEQLLRTLIGRIVMAVLAASIGIGSVLLIDVQAGPYLNDFVTINEVLGYVGLAAAVILTLRVIAGIVRDGSV